MSMCDPEQGRQRGALTAGEARTLLGMVAGVAPEPVQLFVLVALTNCTSCGEPHRLSVDKDVSAEAAMQMLMRAMDLLMEMHE
jgi:hypothetical protein